ncbi:MAG TPA: histidinol dehydrogenase, partial [Luteimonas sp.]|nr:histidinol dehydrogenase [Luteimonas sp.]
MRRIDWSLCDAAARAAALARPGRAGSSETTGAVAAVLDQVAAGGDAAVRQLTLQFDGLDVV